MASVPYSQGIADVAPQSGGTGASPVSVEAATPNAFGAQVGEAAQRAGGQLQQTSDKTFDLANRYAEQAAQAHADDIISNQLVPATTAISSQFYQTRGMDAQKSYQPSLDALQKVQNDAIKDLPPYQQNLVRSFSVRHIVQLQDGMMRHLDQQQTEYEKNSSDAFIGAQSDIAVAAGNDPNTINGAIQSAVGRSTLFSVHNEGVDPNTPDGRAIIDERNRQITGQITQRVVEAAVLRGDIGFANNFYDQNKSNIGGAQQLEIDKSLYAENMKNWAQGAVQASRNGQPIPSFGGDPSTTQVKATVAQIAQNRGADPSIAMMISGLESSFGRTSKNIGGVQTSSATDMATSANDLTTKQIEATNVANKMFGGQATPAQIYTVYQQGVGGGPALLKPENADKKAIDVLASYYPNQQVAVKAIIGNGGNASMTASQFTDFLKQKCDIMYGQVKCDNVPNIGQAITAPHETTGPTVQPAANPVDALKQYDDTFPQRMQSALAMPIGAQRDAFVSALKAERADQVQMATAWKDGLSGKIFDITTKPDFTSMNDPRLTPDLRAALAFDPELRTHAMAMAKQNLEQGSSKDSSKLGDAYWDTFKKIQSGEITNISQLNGIAGTGLTREGLTQSIQDLNEAGDYSTRKKASLDDIELMITRGNKESVEAQQKWKEALPVLLSAIKEREGRQIPPDQYFDKDNKEWIGNSVKNLQMTQAQSVSAKISTNKAAAQRTMGDIMADAQKYKNDPAMQAKLKQEAIDAGFYNRSAATPPQVPMAH